MTESPSHSSPDAKRIFAELVERVEALELPCSPFDLKPILLTAVRKLASGDLRFLEGYIAHQTGLSLGIVQAVAAEMRNYHDEHGLIGDVDTAADVAARLLEESYADPIVWASEHLHIFQGDHHPGDGDDHSAEALCGYFRRGTVQELENHLHEDFAGLAIAQKPTNIARIIDRLRRRYQNERFFDEAPAGLNAANGFVRLSADGELTIEPHSVEHRARYKLTARCNLDACYDDLATALALSLQDPASLAALQEAAGATLFNVTPRLDESRTLVLLYGPRRSGKSTVLSILQGLMAPQTVASVSPSDWGNEYHRAALDGVLLNVVTELSGTIPLSGEHVKKIGSKEPISARHPYGRPFTFRPQAVHWMATNTIPRVSDRSDAFERRMLIIHFGRSLDDHEVEPNFVARVIADPSSFIKWAAEGAARLLRNGRFTLPADQSLAAAIMQHGDDVAAVLAQIGIERAPGERVTTRELKAALSALSPRLGCDPESLTDGHMKRLAYEMRRRYGAERHKTDGRPFYLGVRLRCGFAADANSCGTEDASRESL
jgi:energy-coupling factor transporter ATP-binding protein EcfA2